MIVDFNLIRFFNLNFTFLSRFKMSQLESINNIKDVKTVDAENFDYLLAETNFRIESVFRSRNKGIVEPNVPMVSDPDNSTELQGNPSASKTKMGGNFEFVIDANDYTLFDLKDGEFDVQAQYAWVSEADDPGYGMYNTKPIFGNQCLLSLFQKIELFIDGTSIEANLFPGLSSNAEYALRYPHNKQNEKEFEIHGFKSNDPSEYSFKAAQEVYSDATSLFNKYDWNNQAITLNRTTITAPASGVKGKYLISGYITQRLRLADIFSVVDTLPPLYNHKVMIRFTRGNHNNIICNTATEGGVQCQFHGFTRFKLFQDTYVTTDQFIQTAKNYYSKPIETLITQDKQIITPIINKPTGASVQSFTIGIDAAYKNKLLTIAIPRCTDFTVQSNAIDEYTSSHVLGIDNMNQHRHYDYFKAPANSYTYGGLRYLSVHTNSGLLLYQFDIENDGVIQGSGDLFDMTRPQTQCNYGTYNATPSSAVVLINNYQDVYRQYCKSRLHFQQEEEEALDFDTFMKEYCIFCIDLSCFELSVNENIRITMAFSAWNQSTSATYKYNPFFEYNTESTDGSTVQKSTNLICNLFCDKVLRLLPNRRIELADLMTTNTVEVDNSNMA